MKIDKEEARNTTYAAPLGLKFLEEENPMNIKPTQLEGSASSIASLPIILKEEPESSCNTCLIQRKIEGDATTPRY